MASTIITSFTASFLLVATWAVNLVCYHPQTDSMDPLAPINVTVEWR